MKSSQGRWRSVARGAGGLLALTCSVEAPLPLAVRVAAFGTTGAYVLLTAFTGTRFLSRIMGRLTGRGEARR